MNYQKTALILFLVTTTLWQAACLPVNFAQGSKSQNSEANEQARESATSDSERQNTRLTESKKLPAAKIQQKTDNFVCPEPHLPCQHPQKQFEDWELSFGLPERIVPYKLYKSAPFYAIILKTFPEGCDGLDVDPQVEEERKRIQKQFPSRKVFAENSCANLSAVNYEFEGKRDKSREIILISDYIAVYAGVTEDETRQVYELLQNDYPEARLKKMTAVYEQVEM